MVDPVNGLGSIQNIAQASKSSSAANGRADDVASSSRPVDQVEISSDAREALSVSEAERSAETVQSLLQQNLNAVLGIDPSLAQQLLENEST